MSEIAELCGVTAAEVRGTATFYDMLHTEPVGTYVVAVCTNIACMLGGALELLEHAESTLGVRAGGHDARRRLHPRGGRVPGRLRPHAVRAGQPPLRRRPDAGELRRAGGRPARRAALRHRAARTARWCACAAPSGCRPTAPPSRRERAAVAQAQAARAAARRGEEGLMAITDAPKIITARLGYDDSYTLERYLATGGYDGLRKALTMTPEAVAAEVDAASLLGRGGAGFPAGRKWSMLRKDPLTYLVINGDESRAGHLQGPPAH